MPKPASTELKRRAMKTSRKLRLGQDPNQPRVFEMGRKGGYNEQANEPEEVQPHKKTMSGVLENLKRLGQKTNWKIKPISKGAMVEGKIAF